ncbi:MAG TPA: class I SAM-dependent methyltransferase [Micromonosporaceae bacterium]|nr:class I SAM-dependent methyltransferase [Micromonosporaceae bacterium]
MYGAQLAEIYDAIYVTGHGKDYAAEAASLAALIKARNPRATRVLDVACGTGEHLRHLRDHFPYVAGIELSAPMRELAQAKLPEVRIHAGDMRDFTLGADFDAVVCLFSAIGYTRSDQELRAAVTAMTAHLSTGGVLVIEPWYTPDAHRSGAVHHVVAHTPERTIVRLSYSSHQDRQSRLLMHYLIGDASGINHFTDEHHLTLFTNEEYTAAVTDAGCTMVEFTEGRAAGRHRIIAVKT